MVQTIYVLGGNIRGPENPTETGESALLFNMMLHKRNEVHFKALQII